MKLGERIRALQRMYPRIGPARYLHATSADLRKSGKAIAVLSLLWSEDGRVSIHKTVFDKTRERTVQQWADWLHSSLDDVLRNNVIAYVNRTFGSLWTVDRVIGWHFVRTKRRMRRK
jgi:hypothetical protein